MEKYLWWLKYIFLIFVILVFLALGVTLLISSYHMKSAHIFVMLFFSSSLIILISLSFIVGLISRMIYRIRSEEAKDAPNLY
ncbi:MAG: hypothetical protein ABID54_14190 [Pseudomonadota bacterium]